MANGYWSQSMQEKHEMQMAEHVRQFGPLGELRVQPMAEDYERGRQAVAAERSGQAQQGNAPKTKSRKGKAT